MIIPDCCFFICSEIVMKYILQIFRAFEANRTNNHLKYRSILNGTISMSWTSFGTFGKLCFNDTFCFFTQPNSIVQMDHYHGVPATIRATQAAPPNSRTPRFPSSATAVSPQSLTTTFDLKVSTPVGKWDQQRCRFQNSQHGTSLSLNLLAGFGTC